MTNLKYLVSVLICCGLSFDLSAQDIVEMRWKQVESEELGILAKPIRSAALEYLFYVDILSKIDFDRSLSLELVNDGWAISGQPKLFVHITHGEDDAITAKGGKPTVHPIDWPPVDKDRYSVSVVVAEYDKSLTRSRALMVADLELKKGDRVRTEKLCKIYRLIKDAEGLAIWRNAEKQDVERVNDRDAADLEKVADAEKVSPKTGEEETDRSNK